MINHWKIIILIFIVGLFFLMGLTYKNGKKLEYKESILVKESETRQKDDYNDYFDILNV